MSFFTVSHTNPGAVSKRLTRLALITKSDLLKQTVEKQLDIVYDQMYRMAPVKTGYMRSTIKMMVEREGARHVFGMITVSARYAYYVDQGMSPRGRRAAQPFWSNNVVGLSVELLIVLRNLYAQQF